MTDRATHGEAREVHLKDYLRVLAHRRWIVAAVALSVFAAVGIKTYRTVPTYRASSTVQIERIDPTIMKYQDVVGYDPSFLSYQDYYQTQYKLLESRSVAAKAVRRLGLRSEPEFLVSSTPGVLGRIFSSLTDPLRWRKKSAAKDGADPDPDGPLVDALMAGLRVEPVKNSHLVQVAFISRSPVLAAKVANGVSEAYISFGMESKVDTSENAQNFLTEQIAKLRKDVAELEGQVQIYGESKEIIPTGAQENTTLSALEDLQRAFTVAQADRAEKEGVWTAVGTTPDEALTQVLASPLIQNLSQEVASLERERSEMARRFKPGWPALAQLSAKLEQAEGRLLQETSSLATSARQAAGTGYRSALEREKNLKVLLDRQKRTAIKLSSDSIEYTNLRSEVQKKRETLDELLKRQSEIALASHVTDARQSSTRVIDRARVPDRIYKPNTKANLLIGLAAGLSLGATLAFLIEYLDNTIKTAEEIRRLSGYAAIGVIPEHRPAGPRPVRTDAPPDQALESALDLITHLDSRSPLAEAYKELRTATLLASPDQPPRTILVTSCLPQEGKSLTSLNLSIALAQAGKRVLLVDTDLRRPRLHRALRLSNDRGISTYLSGNEPVDRLVRPTSIHGLDALPSGPIPPNPSELLASRNFLWLVREFAGESGYDHLVFDSPPLLSVADPVVIATVCDGTIIVVHSGKTPREALARGAAKLRQGTVNVLGVVLNNVADADRSYYYHARYYRRDEPEENERSTTSA